nr:unnamed protein product [Callosobruchus analis]
MCEEAVKLSRFQKEIEEKIPSAKNKLLDKSVNATCRVLLEINELKLAESSGMNSKYQTSDTGG